VDWIAVSQQPGEQRSVDYVTKPAALVLLLLFAATGRDPSWWLVAALGFSILGDVYLMLPIDLFRAGVAAFLIAILAYITDFEAAFAWRLLWFLVFGSAAYLLAGRHILGAIEDQSNRLLVGIYMVAVSFMVGSAVASGSASAAIGALLFLSSDTLLAWNRFVQPFSNAQVMVMVTYHLGQLLLVTALRS